MTGKHRKQNEDDLAAERERIAEMKREFQKQVDSKWTETTLHEGKHHKEK